MACRYTYKGKTYEAHEFDDVLRAMSPAEAAAFMPGVQAVPTAPFVDATDKWVALALKRVIAMAAREGYDRVAFVTGEQSADRYDLSKAIEALRVSKRDDGTLDLSAKPKGARSFEGIASGVAPAALDQYIPKDMAKRVVSDLADPFSPNRSGGAAEFSRTYTGLDLKVGGEGMRAFYDKIVPSVAKDVLKKVGGGSMRAGEAAKPNHTVEHYLDLGQGREAAIAALKPIVDSGVIAALQNDQVTQFVVEALPVDVVDMLADKGISAKEFARNPKVLIAELSIDRGLSVARGLRDALTSLRTQLRAGLDARYKARLDGEVLPAVRASDIDTDVAAGILFGELGRGGNGVADGSGGVGLRGARTGAEARGIPAGAGRVEDGAASRAGFVDWHGRIVPQRGGDPVLRKAPQFDITPSMREKAASGLPLFSPQREYTAANGQAQSAADTTSQEAGTEPARLAPVRGAAEPVQRRARIVGLGIAEDIKRAGSKALVGNRVASPDDLAALAQVYRDPAYETFRVFFVKGGKIVHATGVSSRMPGETAMVPAGMTDAEYVQWFKDQMRPESEGGTGADGYYMLHNHPSGDPSPSAADLRMTGLLGQKVPGLLSHVVINSNKYAVIEPAGKAWRHVTRYFGEDELRKASKPHNALGRQITTPDELAMVGKSMQKPGWITLIGADANGDSSLIAEVPSSALTRSPGYLKGLVRGLMRKSGSTKMFAVGEAGDISSRPIQDAVLHGVLEDAVPRGGKSLRQQGLSSFGGRAFAGTRGMAVAEPAGPVDSAAFKRWFGDSKVVDAQGRPLVVYHGTKADFAVFDLAKLGASTDHPQAELGFFFSPKAGTASGYPYQGGDGRNVMPAYVALKNPYLMEMDEFYGMDFKRVAGKDKARAFREKLKAQGYDGIILGKARDHIDAEEEGVVIAFHPEQIKSATGNRGTYDPGDANILRSPQAPYNPGPRTEPPAETVPRALQRKLQDQFNRFTVIRDWAIEQGLNMTPDSNVWAYEERMHGRIATRVEDFRERTVRPKVEAIQKAGFTMAQVAEFLHAQHAEERNKQIESIDPTNTAGSGMTTAAAKAILAKADPKLVALANDFRKITEDTKAILLRAGIINKDMTDAWEAAYKNYVPLKGGDEAAQQGTGKGLAANGKQKRALGHGQRSEFIIENILRDHERAITVAEKNLVGHSLLAFIADLGRDDIATIGQPEKRKVLKNSTDYEVLDGNGMRVAIFDSQAGAAAFISKHGQAGLFGNIKGPLTANPVRGDPSVAFMATPMLADNEVNVYVKGHAIRVQLNDPLLARAYTRSGQEGLNQLMALNREINAYFSKVYTGYNPEFLFTNMARDWTTGLINVTGQYGAGIAAKAAADYPRAFASLMRYGITGKATPDIAQYRSAGGSTGAAYLSDIERIGRDVQDAYDEYRGVIETYKASGGIAAGRAAARKFVGHLLGWIEHINAAGENAMRLAVFEAVRDTKGFTVNDAASAAKNSTVNFNRRGEWGQLLGAMYLFFNPAIQGTAAIADALVKGKHKEQALALTGSLAALAYFAAAGQFGGGDDDDEAWDAIPDHVKDKNLIIRTGEKTYITIPVPYGYGFFYSLGNAIYDWTKGRRDKDRIALNVAQNLIEHFAPAVNPMAGDKPETAGLVELVPGAVGGELMRNVIRVAANRSSLGSDIVPDSPFDQGKPDAIRLYRTTKGTVYEKAASAMSEATGGSKSQKGGIDVSPETLKYWVRAITGGAGAMVIDSIGATRRLIERQDKTLTDEERKALESRPEEIPILRRFSKEESVRDKRRQFWDAVEKVKEAKSDLRRAKGLFDEAGEEKVWAQRGELVAMGAYTDSLVKMVKAQRDLVDEVMTDETTSLAYKRARVKVLEAEEATLYAEYIKEFSAERQRAKAERAAN